MSPHTPAYLLNARGQFVPSGLSSHPCHGTCFWSSTVTHFHGTTYHISVLTINSHQGEMQVDCVFSPSDHCQGKIAGYGMNLFLTLRSTISAALAPWHCRVCSIRSVEWRIRVLDSPTEKHEVFCYSAWTLIDRHESINHSTRPDQVKADIGKMTRANSPNQQNFIIVIGLLMRPDVSECAGRPYSSLRPRFECGPMLKCLCSGTRVLRSAHFFCI